LKHTKKGLLSKILRLFRYSAKTNDTAQAWPTLAVTPTDLNSSSPLPLQVHDYAPRKSSIIILTLPGWLDGKHVVFGEVMDGYDIVEKIENVAKGAQDRPQKPVTITKSGELEMPEGDAAPAQEL
jgi:hypothetical protein